MISRNRVLCTALAKFNRRALLICHGGRKRYSEAASDIIFTENPIPSIHRGFAKSKITQSPSARPAKRDHSLHPSFQDDCKGLPTSQLVRCMFRFSELDWTESNNPQAEIYLMDLHDVLQRIKQEVLKYDMSDMRSLLLDADLVRIQPIVDGLIGEDHPLHQAASKHPQGLVAAFCEVFLSRLEHCLVSDSPRASQLIDIASSIKELVTHPRLCRIIHEELERQQQQVASKPSQPPMKLISLLFLILRQQQPSSCLQNSSTKSAVAIGLKVLRRTKTHNTNVGDALNTLLHVSRTDPQVAALLLPLDVCDVLVVHLSAAVRCVGGVQLCPDAEWLRCLQVVRGPLSPLLTLLQNGQPVGELHRLGVGPLLAAYVQQAIDRLTSTTLEGKTEHIGLVYDRLQALAPLLKSVCNVVVPSLSEAAYRGQFGAWTNCVGERAARERLRLVAEACEAGQQLTTEAQHIVLEDLRELNKFLEAGKSNPGENPNLRLWAGLNWCEVSAFVNTIRHLATTASSNNHPEISVALTQLMIAIHEIFVRAASDTYSPEIFRYTFAVTQILDENTLQATIDRLPPVGKLRAWVQFQLGMVEGKGNLGESVFSDLTRSNSGAILVTNDSARTLFSKNLQIKELARICLYLDKYNGPRASEIFTSRSKFKWFYFLMMETAKDILEGRNGSYSWVFSNHDSLLNFCNFVFAAGKMCVKGGVFGGNRLLELGYEMLKMQTDHPHLQLRLIQFICQCYARTSNPDLKLLDKHLSDLFDRAGGMQIGMIEGWINLVKRYKSLPKTEQNFEQLVLNKLDISEYCGFYPVNMQIRIIYSAIYLCETKKPAQRAIQKLMTITTAELRKAAFEQEEMRRQGSKSKKARLVDDFSAASEKLLGILNKSDNLAIDPKVNQDFQTALTVYMEQKYGKQSQANTTSSTARSADPARQKSVYGQSNLQKKVAEILKELGYAFEEEIMIHGYRVDFLLAEKTILEAVGSAHFDAHGKLDHDEELKHQTLSKFGYKIRYVTQDLMGGGKELKKALIREVIEGKLDALEKREMWKSKKLRPLKIDDVQTIVSNQIKQPDDDLGVELELGYSTETITENEPTKLLVDKPPQSARTFNFNPRINNTKH